MPISLYHQFIGKQGVIATRMDDLQAIAREEVAKLVDRYGDDPYQLRFIEFELQQAIVQLAMGNTYNNNKKGKNND
jgi:hypothetical protein